MHIQSKFDDGKQINRIQCGSWQDCCAGAGLQCNMGPSWGPEAWEKAVGVPPSKVFQTAVLEVQQQVDRDWKWKTTDKSKQQRKKAKYSAVDNSLSSRGHMPGNTHTNAHTKL